MDAIFGFLGERDTKLLHQMGEALSHRGPGLNVHEQTHASLGYRGERGRSDQTGMYSTSTHTVAASGWIRDASGKRLGPSSILRELTSQPEGFATQVRGDFVLAFFDGESVRLLRDGAGMRTLFWAHDGERFLFASESKALLVSPRMRRVIRSGAVAQFLTFSFVPGAGTMLEGVSELPAGHQVLIRHGTVPSPKRYFFFERAESAPESQSGTVVDEDEWVERFSRTLASAIHDRLPGTAPFGVFLSGGLDSSAVVAALARRLGPGIPTWSIHFGPNYANELDYAREVATRWGTDHEEVHIEPRHFLPRLRRVVWHLDDPIGDPITVPNFELARRASARVRWVFNGEGGDPLFGGPKNIQMLLHHWYGGIERGPRFRERAYLTSYRRAFDEISRLLTPEALSGISYERDLEAVLTPFFDSEPPRLFLNKLCAINIRLKGAHLILPKVERMLAANGVTSLSPLFDSRLIELSFAMPPTLKLRAGIEKVIIKRAFADALPDSVLKRPKSGMRVPVHYWFRKETRSYIRRLLSPRAVARAGIFRPERVKQLLDYNTDDGAGRYGIRLWMLMTFELWRRIVVEREAV
ncbi:MAG: asparagine synthase-related protein [Myxococcota bacterium]